VTFKRGTTTLGTVALTTGVAKLQTAKIPKGTNAITASYSGAADYAASSATLSQVVK
jgi:hypothetical protein